MFGICKFVKRRCMPNSCDFWLVFNKACPAGLDVTWGSSGVLVW